MSSTNYRRFTIVYCILILLVSSIPGKSFPEIRFLSFDKLIHLMEYSILGWLLMGALEQTRGKVVLMMFILGVLFGAVDEMWQSFVPGRFSSSLDWMADSAGVIAGGILHLKSYARR